MFHRTSNQSHLLTIHWAEFMEAWKSDWNSSAMASLPQLTNLLTVHASLKFIGSLVLKEMKHLVIVVHDKCTFKYAVTDHYYSLYYKIKVFMMQ